VIQGKVAKQRSEFPTGDDCRAFFLKYQDNRNADVDVWQIEMRGKTFLILLMCLKKRIKSRFVFGTIFDSDKKPIWTFREDKRVKQGFRGDLYTKVIGNTTYVIFDNFGTIKFRIPLAEILQVNDFVTDTTCSSKQTTLAPMKAEVRQYTPVSDEMDEMEWFRNNVLLNM
jgi:hypothetical protein